MGFSRQEYWSGLSCPSPGIHWYGGGITMPVSPPPFPWWNSLKLWFCVFKVPTFDSNMVTFYRTLLNITLLSSFVLGFYLPTPIQVFPSYMLSLFDMVFVVVVQSPSRVQLFATLRMVARQASLNFTISWSLLKLTSLELMMPSNHLLLFTPFCCPQSFPSIRVLSNELAFHVRWPKY